MLHCPLPSRQSCLSEQRPGHPASPSPLARAGSQCLIHAPRETSNLRGCEMLGKINAGWGFINSLFLLRTAALSWAAKMWTRRALPQGNLNTLAFVLQRAGAYSIPASRVSREKDIYYLGLSSLCSGLLLPIKPKRREDTATLSSQLQNFISSAPLPAEKFCLLEYSTCPTEPSFITCLPHFINSRFNWRTL